MDEKKRAVQIEAIKAAKKKGVTAIKVELEAQMGRRSLRYNDRDAPPEGMRHCTHCSDGRAICQTCNGSNEERCANCAGNGRVNNARCAGCDGNGWRGRECQNELCDYGTIDCTHCDGEGHVEIVEGDVIEQNLNWASEYVCFNWLMRRIGAKTGVAEQELEERFPESSGREYMTNPFPWMKFAKFYYDGSVDSELTFTVKLDDEENIFKVVTVIEAWNEMAAAMGVEQNVNGAGMHTAFMWSANYSYPHNEDDYSREENIGSHRLDEESLRNFKKSVTQLLPALYFLGTTNEHSRGLNFRTPRIGINYRQESRNTNAKYQAVTYRQGAMEFRLFDTCYKQPEAFLDNVVVMCNTLRYLRKTYLSPGISKKVGRRMIFGNDANNQLERLYASVTHLEALNIGLERIKPSYYTIKEIKQQRKFTRTKTFLKKLTDKRTEQVKREFEEYTERFNWEVAVRVMRAKADYTERIVGEKQPDELKDLSMTEVEIQVKEQLEEYKKTYETRRKPEKNYTKDRLKQLESAEVGQYTLTLA